jgi:uncharacterized protein YoxC
LATTPGFTSLVVEMSGNASFEEEETPNNSFYVPKPLSSQLHHGCQTLKSAGRDIGESTKISVAENGSGGESDNAYGDRGMFTRKTVNDLSNAIPTEVTESIFSSNMLNQEQIQTSYITSDDLLTDDSGSYKKVTVARVDRRRHKDKFALAKLFSKITKNVSSVLEAQMSEQRVSFRHELNNICSSVKAELNRQNSQTDQCLDHVNKIAEIVSKDLSKYSKVIDSIEQNVEQLGEQVSKVNARVTAVENSLTTELQTNQHNIKQCHMHFSDKFNHLSTTCNHEFSAINKRLSVLENKVDKTSHNIQVQANPVVPEHKALSFSDDAPKGILRLDTPRYHNSFIEESELDSASDHNPYLHNLCNQISGVKPWRPPFYSPKRSVYPHVDSSSEDAYDSCTPIKTRGRAPLKSSNHKIRAKTHRSSSQVDVHSDSSEHSFGSFSKTRNDKREFSRRSHLNLPDFDGSYDAGIFLRQVSKIVELSQWNEVELCANLMSSLKGPAREILSCFPPECLITSRKIAKSLSAKFGRRVHSDVARASLSDLKQVKGQTIRQLSLDVERLIGQAYGSVDAKTRESLSIDALLQSLYDHDVRLQTRLNHPKTLSQAVLIAESVESAVRQARGYNSRKVSFVNNIQPSSENRETKVSMGSSSSQHSAQNMNHQNNGQQQFNDNNNRHVNVRGNPNSYNRNCQPNDRSQFSKSDTVDNSTFQRPVQGNFTRLRQQGQPQQW